MATELKRTEKEKPQDAADRARSLSSERRCEDEHSRCFEEEEEGANVHNQAHGIKAQMSAGFSQRTLRTPTEAFPRGDWEGRGR